MRNYEKKSKIEQAIRVVHPSGCNMCGFFTKKSYYEIRIVSVDSLAEGWVVRGKGHTIERICPGCGQVYEALAYAIPIHCSSFPCPKCGELQNFHYRIQSIKTDKDSFEFEAEIECKECKKKKSFTKMIRKILNVINLEISPKGITVKSK